MLFDRAPTVRPSGWFVASLVLTLALGPVPSAGRQVAAPALDGKWVYEAQTIGGSDLPRDRRDAIWVEIEGGAFRRCGTGSRLESRLAVDAGRRPAEFTLAFTHPVTGKVSETRGIYKLDGDRLTLCYDNTGRTRPTRFESPAGRDEVVLSVLRHAKQ